MPSLVTLGAASLLDDDGRPWALPYDKVRALALLLALQPNAHPRERLADMLWPGSAGQQARANLRRALHDLRRALQAQPGAAQDLQADKKTVRLLAAPPRWQVDALRFQQALVPLLARANRAAPDDFQPVMALYGGPFLQGLQLDDAPEFDQWVAQQRDHLQGLALQGLQHWAALHEARGDWQAALLPLERSRAIEPWAEPVLRQRLRLLARSSPAAALREFERFEDGLLQALGLRPEARTLVLAAELRRQQLAPPTPTEVAPEPPEPAVLAEPMRRRLLVLACNLEPVGDAAMPVHPDAALQAASRLLQAHGASVQQADSGELLAWFGHLRSGEGTVRQALQAAMALCTATPAGLCCRVGVHLGWVSLGPDLPAIDAWGALRKQARRLALAAAPGQVLLSDAVRRADGGHHRLHAAGAGTWLLEGAASPPPQPPLLERDPLQHALLAHWVLARGGGPRALLLQGEPGIGKSRLLDDMEAVARAQHRPVHRLPWTTDLRALLAGAARQGGPGLVLLDDLHRAAPRALQALCGWLRTADAPLLVLMASRLAAPASLAPWLAQVLQVPPLSAAAMQALLSQAGVRAAADRSRLLQQAAGVPLLALSLAAQCTEQRHAGEDTNADAPADGPVPPPLWDLLAAQLEAAGPGACSLARWAAVIGAEFDEAQLLRLLRPPGAAGADPVKAAEVRRGLDRLVACGVLQRLAQQPYRDAAEPWQAGHAAPPPAGSYRFRQVLLQQAALQMLPPAEHDRLRRLLADAAPAEAH